MKTQASKKTRPTFSCGGAGVSPALCIACDDPPVFNGTEASEQSVNIVNCLRAVLLIGLISIVYFYNINYLGCVCGIHVSSNLTPIIVGYS